MSGEPEHKFEYELTDDEGRAVPVTSDLEINANEKSRGAVGMLEWCRRVVDTTGRWGFLPGGGSATVIRVKVSLMIFEEEKWQSLMDMEMAIGDDGFVRISGKFPITIT